MFVLVFEFVLVLVLVSRVVSLRSSEILQTAPTSVLRGCTVTNRQFVMSDPPLGGTSAEPPPQGPPTGGQAAEPATAAHVRVFWSRADCTLQGAVKSKELVAAEQDPVCARRHTCVRLTAHNHTTSYTGKLRAHSCSAVHDMDI